MTKVIFTLILLCIVTSVFGQRRKKKVIRQRFKAGLIIGANLAQINGDLFSGYDKFGLQFGARGVMVLSPKLQASIELLYSQKGSKRPRKSVLQQAVDIQLNYAETPILLNFLSKEKVEAGYFRNHFHIGISYSRLLKTKVEAAVPHLQSEEVDYNILEPSFKGNDLAVVAGLTHYLSKHFGLTIRHSVSLTKMFENMGEDTTGRIKKWHSYYFTGQLLYMF